MFSSTFMEYGFVHAKHFIFSSKQLFLMRNCKIISQIIITLISFKCRRLAHLIKLYIARSCLVFPNFKSF